MGRGRDGVGAICIFLSLFMLMISAPVQYGSDAEYAVPQLVSILQNGDQNLDEFAHLHGKQYQITKIGDHYFDALPY